MTFVKVENEYLTGTSRTVILFFLNNICLFEYHPRDKKKCCSSSASSRQKRSVGLRRKASRVQNASRASSKQAKTMSSSEAAELMDLISQNSAIARADKRFRGSPEPAVTRKSKKCSLCE